MGRSIVFAFVVVLLLAAFTSAATIDNTSNTDTQVVNVESPVNNQVAIANAPTETTTTALTSPAQTQSKRLPLTNIFSALRVAVKDFTGLQYFQILLACFVGFQIIVVIGLVYQTTLESCTLSESTLEYLFDAEDNGDLKMRVRTQQTLTTQRSTNLNSPSDFKPAGFIHDGPGLFKLHTGISLVNPEPANSELAHYLLQVQRIQNLELRQGRVKSSWIPEDILWPNNKSWDEMWAVSSDQAVAIDTAKHDLDLRFKVFPDWLAWWKNLILPRFDPYFVLPVELRPKHTLCSTYAMSTMFMISLTFLIKTILQLIYALPN